MHMFIHFGQTFDVCLVFMLLTGCSSGGVYNILGSLDCDCTNLSITEVIVHPEVSNSTH